MKGQVSVLVRDLGSCSFLTCTQTAFFDVPLHSHFFRASSSGSRYDLRKIFNGTLVKMRPGDAVTYVDNHE
jgi:alpha-amylase